MSSSHTERIRAAIAARQPSVRAVSQRIHENPELRFEEVKAAGWLADALAEAGIDVERGLGGLPTAFRARVGSGERRVAILAEYDALPEIGHACGHNLIAGGALSAFLALADQKDLPGQVELIGTPAEEGGGGKIKLLEAGVFEKLDAALMFHPFDRDIVAHRTLASYYIDVTYTGKPSHAAIAPHTGSSALTACMDAFRLIDGQRIHFRDGARVHGYITDGGQASNIIVERAAAQFSVRATTMAELERVLAIVQRCMRAAAMASGVEVELDTRPGYKNMVNNLSMARRFATHLGQQGRQEVIESDPKVGAGSTDMGDVSHAVPSIHPWVAICDKGETTCHQHKFAAYANSDRGYSSMFAAAEALALTALDVLENDELRQQVRAEFEASERVT